MNLTDIKEIDAVMEQWQKEFEFWHVKFGRAWTRYQIAAETNDRSKMEIAGKQDKLYKRRMDAVVPTDVRARWDKNREELQKAAIEEAVNEEA
jgi:hypothetical protein